jgi:hypothetical protein
MSQSKFVSSIPNNKLEPVFLGGGEGPSSKSSGAYVPAFLKGKNNQEQNNKTDTRTVQEFKMTEDDFPSFANSKESTKTTNTPKTFTNYSDALKKDIDKPVVKANKENRHGVNNSTPKKHKKPILDDYSGYDSDDHY